MKAQDAKDFATPIIDREYFYENFSGDCVWNRQELNRIFDFMDASELVLRTDEMAYILATIRHECGQLLLPTREETDVNKAPWLKGKHLPYMIGIDSTGQNHPRTGYLYFGRGYVQLTWFSLYKYFGERLQLDLIGNPDLLLVPRISWDVLEIGMYEGKFTGKKMSNYFHDGISNFIEARKIINGTDQAKTIETYALQFFYALRFKS